MGFQGESLLFTNDGIYLVTILEQFHVEHNLVVQVKMILLFIDVISFNILESLVVGNQ